MILVEMVLTFQSPSKKLKIRFFLIETETLDLYRINSMNLEKR
jgi:hypothetical protein